MIKYYFALFPLLFDILKNRTIWGMSLPPLQTIKSISLEASLLPRSSMPKTTSPLGLLCQAGATKMGGMGSIGMGLMGRRMTAILAGVSKIMDLGFIALSVGGF
jgi:hypothetical protein